MARPKIKSGDQVLVLTGKDAGKKGKVTQVFPGKRLVVVEGVNSMTKNIRSRKQGEKGQLVQFNGAIQLSNVMLLDPKSNQPTRVGTVIIDGKKHRRSVRSKETFA